MKKCPVVHFEMLAKDNKRASDFYSKTFGWNMNQLGEEMGNYLLAETADSVNGMSTTPGTINGGFYSPTPDQKVGQNTHVVIGVDDIAAKIKEVKANGGQILDEVMDIPGIGKYVSIIDTEGNTVGILQPAR